MKSKQCELILSSLHLLDLQNIVILQISLQRSELERSEHYLGFFNFNVSACLGGREINERKIALALLTFNCSVNQESTTFFALRPNLKLKFFADWSKKIQMFRNENLLQFISVLTNSI